MYKVIKRDGSVVDFDVSKIKRAIIKAFESVDRSYTDDIIDFIVLKVTADFEKKLNKETGILGEGYKHDSITVEDIQDSVETVLVKSGYDQVAKSFILYRQQHAKMRSVKNTLLDYKKTVEGYLGGSDWRVKENSTVNYSVGGLILNQAGAMTANYWLSEVYDGEVAAAHRNCDFHLHDLSMLSPYCCGHDLKRLIAEGLGGVPGKISSGPAGHLSTLCNQMVNYLGCLQNEWSGAQAFSNFDTLLAPFVKKDNLSYKQVKQAIQSFVFGVNTPSRWGCVPETYRVMTTRGWKGIDELKPGDTLYTWKNGKLNLCKNNATVIKEHDGELFQFTNPHYKYKQEVTDYHRCLVCKTNKKLEEAVVMTAGDIAADPYNHNYALPTGFTEINVHPGIDLSDDEIRLAAMIYTDGNICHYEENSKKLRITYFKSVKRNAQIHAEEIFNRLGIAVEPKHYYTEMSHEFGILKWEWYGETARRILDLIGSKQVIHERFFEMNQRQAELFLDTWMMHDGLEEKKRAQVDNYIIRDQLLFINVLAGNISSHWSKMLPSGASVNYVKQTQVDKVKFEVSTRRYKGRVWCPSSDDGTAIFMNDRGGVFISANCQAPFSNVSIDWTMHPDLKDMPAIVGGVEQDFTYGDCEKEQAMINKAFMEVMMEGDYNGRGHQYPIPNYSITKEFKWDDSENNRLLFGMAAKYGIPYFSNYVNSDMDPREVKSMCPLTGDTNILVMVNGRMEVVSIEELHTNKFFNENGFKVTDGYNWHSAKTNAQEPTDVRTLYSHGKKLISMGINHLQPVYANEDGEQYTLDIEPDVNSKLITLPAKDIRAGAYIPKICGRKPGVRPIQVTSIGFDAPQSLYCLEVDSEEHVFALANGVLTHNCRLRLDMREVVKKNGGGLFGAQSKTGSVAVVTLNMPRLGYLAKDEDDFFKRLDRLMDIAARSLHTRRQAVTQLMDAGLYPYTKHYIGSFNTYFSTIATVGMNEMCKNARWLRSPIHEKAGQEFTIKVLKYMVARLPKYQMEYDAMYNLESAPAESCSFRLAKHDKERYPDIITAGTESSPYYTNSSNIEVGHTANIYEALENQDPIQILYTSGTVFHAYLGEQLPDWKAAATIVKKICENYRLPYITLSPTYSVCPEHGYIPGAHTTCPHCKTSNGEITNG